MATLQYAQSTSLTGISGAAAYGYNTFAGNELIQIINEKLSPRVEVLANKSATTFSSIITKETPLNPRGLRVPIEKRGNASQIFHGEGGKLSVGDGREYISANVFYSRFSQASRLTLDALLTMEKGQALETLKDRMRQDVADALRFLSVSVFGNGEGTRAISTGVVGSGTDLNNVALKAPYFSKFIQLGGRYDLHDGTTKAKQNTAVLICDGVDQVAGTADFTTSVAVDFAANDILVKEGSYGLDLAGLDYLVDETLSGDFFGIPRSTGTQFRAVVDRSGGALSVAKLNYVIQEYKHKKGADKWNPKEMVIIMSPAEFGAYINLGDPTVNASASGVRLTNTVSNGKLDFGYNASSLTFQGIDIVEDDACPPGTIHIINKTLLQKGVFCPLRAKTQLAGASNGVFPIPGMDSSGVGSYYDQGIYYLEFKGNTFTTDPSAHIKITGLTTTGLALGKV